MSEPFIGEIVMFGGNFAPRSWAQCDGQLMPISQNTALFSILGTTYGGNGQTTFGLPDMRGRSPMHQGQGPGLTPRSLGEQGGSENDTLTLNQLPAHNHPMQCTGNAADLDSPVNAIPAKDAASVTGYYSSGNPTANMKVSTIGNSGGNQPHSLVHPFLAVNFIICLFGVFPSRN